MKWSKWRRFPNPQKEEYIFAPIGHDVYQLRLISTKQSILYGSGKNLSGRLAFLLQAHFGMGTRKHPILFLTPLSGTKLFKKNETKFA